jgi:acetylornithine deacetylase/succinyl-diaminopimelate desuccinylase-like protein
VLDTVEKLTGQMWPGVPVIPYMSPATTDMRWMRSVGVPMYGVSGMFVDPADTGVHGVDEHIGQKQLYEGREFLYRFVKLLTS